MSGRTQFWLGMLALTLGVGLFAGGLFAPRPSYSQGIGEGRTLNFALVASDLKGTKANSRIIFVVDDRTEAVYVLEATSVESKTNPSVIGFCDLRKVSDEVQKLRSRQEKGHPKLP